MSLNWLLVFIPLAVALDWYGVSPVAVFVASALAIVPLAGLMGAGQNICQPMWDRPSVVC